MKATRTPWLMAGLILAATLLLVLKVHASPVPGGDTTLLGLVNQARTAAGLPALTVDPSLTKAAGVQAEAEGNQHYYGHISKKGSTPQSRLKAAKWPANAPFSECLAGGREPANCVEVWLLDPANRRVLLSPSATQIGAAYVTVNGSCLGTYAVIMVGRR